MLTAAGGKGVSGPTYWWVCQGCGSRWERKSKEQAKEPPAPPVDPPPIRKTKAPLQPRLTPGDRRTPELSPKDIDPHTYLRLLGEEKYKGTEDNENDVEMIPGPSSSATGSGNPNP